MAVIKTFRFGDYEDSAKEDIRAERVRQQPEDEGLTGAVQGLPASDLEERAHRAMNRYHISHVFQQEIPTAYALPTQERKVDFFAKYRSALEVDGYIGHYYKISQKANDWVRDLFLNEALRNAGLPDVQHIPYWKLDNQDRADATIRGMNI